MKNKKYSKIFDHKSVSLEVTVEISPNGHASVSSIAGGHYLVGMGDLREVIEKEIEAAKSTVDKRIEASIMTSIVKDMGFEELTSSI